MTTIETTEAAKDVADKIDDNQGWVVFGHYCWCVMDGLSNVSSPWKIYLDAGGENVLVVDAPDGFSREQFGPLMSAVLAGPLGLTDNEMNFVLLVDTDSSAQDMVNELGACFGIQGRNILIWAKHQDGPEDTRVPVGPLMKDAIDLVGPELAEEMFIRQDEPEPAGEQAAIDDGE